MKNITVMAAQANVISIKNLNRKISPCERERETTKNTEIFQIEDSEEEILYSRE